jgi:hypothetical protein
MVAIITIHAILCPENGRKLDAISQIAHPITLDLGG